MERTHGRHKPTLYANGPLKFLDTSYDLHVDASLIDLALEIRPPSPAEHIP